MLWYVGYGSNLDRHRFLHYLDGGAAPGAGRAVPGARDGSPPADERAVTLPGRMFFGWTSPTWGGGICFLDADADDTAYGRAYLLTDEQFADVLTQEMHRSPGPAVDLTTVLAERRHSLGPGRYETMHLVGELEGHPMITFTAGDHAMVPPNPPTAAYLATVARGLRDTHGLDAAEVAEHLSTRPGADTWTAEQVLDLLDGSIGK